MIEVDYVKISFLKDHALKSYRPKHPPERYYFWTRYMHIKAYIIVAIWIVNDIIQPELHLEMVNE